MEFAGGEKVMLGFGIGGFALGIVLLVITTLIQHTEGNDTDTAYCTCSGLVCLLLGVILFGSSFSMAKGRHDRIQAAHDLRMQGFKPLNIESNDSYKHTDVQATVRTPRGCVAKLPLKENDGHWYLVQEVSLKGQLVPRAATPSTISC